MGMEPKTFQERLELLRKLAPKDRLEALTAILEQGAPAERASILVELLELAALPQEGESTGGLVGMVTRRWSDRRRQTADAALAAIVRRWDSVPGELREAARSIGEGRWEQAAAGLADDSDPAARRSLAGLCAECQDPSLAGAMVRLLSDPDAATASAAERAILALAFSSVDGDGRARALVEEAVSRAVTLVGEHRRRGPLLAAMAMLDTAALWRARARPGAALPAWFVSGDAESHSALKAAVRLSAHPLARLRALEWLTVGGLAGSCVDRMARAGTAEEHEIVLESAHLLANPARARQAAKVHVARPATKGAGRVAQPNTGPIPDGAALGALSTAARRGVARFVDALDVGIETRRAALEPLLNDEDGVARLLSAARTTPAGRLDLCFDSDPVVARSAFLAWSMAGERGPGGAFESRLSLRDDASRRRALGHLSRSPHEAVRRLTGEESEFLEFLDPSSSASRAGARWLLVRDPVTFDAKVLAALNSTDAQTRIRAVRLVRHLRVCDRFENAILAIAENSEGSSGRATATAVAALGDLQSPASIAVVQARLGDSDRRVRANAVEAVARQSRAGDLAVADPAVYGLLIELKDDGDPRVRANALRALLGRPPSGSGSDGIAGRIYEPTAVGALADMLTDPRPEHRLSAAWLAGRVLPFHGRVRLGKKFAELATRIGEIASSDGDENVRRRAGQCAEALKADLRRAWAAQTRKREQKVAEAAA